MATNSAFAGDNVSEILSDIEISIKEVDHLSANTEVIDRPNRIKDYTIILVLFVINLLNYIDRFTIAGVLDDVKTDYNVDNAEAGLLQTSFIITYMIMSPVFGYLGDRFSRKNLILGGVTFWSIITLSSSFIPSNMFALFVVMRSLVGIGEASYSTVAPTIISDIFVGDLRTKVMAFFYFAVPVGSGLGFIIGQELSKAFNDWHYALRFSPILGLLCVILLFFFVQEPTRGSSEGGTHLASSPWIEDIKQLTKNRSFILISFGFTSVCFVIGSLSWWSVFYLNDAINAKANSQTASTKYRMPIIFGAMTMVAGIIGVLVGTESGRRLRKKWPSSDPLVCAFGLICASPLIIVALVLAKEHLNWSLFSIFVGMTLLCLNWALVADMTMGVVIPTRRATATAYQMILSHAFGDAGSPYIIGTISDKLNAILSKSHTNLESAYLALQYALYVNTFVAVIGGGFFLWCSLYIVHDRKKVSKVIEESIFHYETVGSAYTPEDSQIMSDSDDTPYQSRSQRII